MKNTGFERLSRHQHDEHEQVDKALFWVSVGSGVIAIAFLVWLVSLLTNL